MRTCRYCKREDEHTICVSCDGKHSARTIFRKLNIERSIHNKKYNSIPFREEKIKANLIETDIKGLEGLSQNERKVFFSAFENEWNRLKANV